MIKTASTSTVIELLRNFEEKHGAGAITSIGTVCSGARTVEYIFHVKDKNGDDISIEIPSEDENAILNKN